jgi:MarR family transcriptional regulator for hemolysin
MGMEIRREIGQILMLMARDFQRRLDADLHERGIPGIGARHRAVFLFLARNGATRAVDLASSAGIRPQSMMKIVHELEELGLVVRRRDPSDSRAKLIDFTPVGREFIAQLTSSTETVSRQYIEVLGEQRFAQTFEELKRLLQSGDQNP